MFVSLASSGFFDDFFILILTAAIALTLVDWCLGEQRRHNMREKVGVWWVWVKDIPWSGVEERSARAVLRFLHRALGPRWLSGRCALFVFGLSIFGTLLIYLPLFIFDEHPRVALGWASSEFQKSLLVYLPTNAVLDWLSVGVTMWFLKLLARKASFFVITVLVCADLVIAFVICIVLILFLNVVKLFFSSDQWFGTSLLVAACAFVTTLVPTLLHIGFSFILLVSKALRPVLHPLTAMLLLRFHESKKGVLTILAITGASGLKLLQEWVKYL